MFRSVRFGHIPRAMPSRSPRFRRRSAGLAACALLALLGRAEPAGAGCLADAGDPSLIVCTGADSQGFEAAEGVNDLTVNIEDGATVTNDDPALSEKAAIRVRDGSTVVNLGSLDADGDLSRGVEADNDATLVNRGLILVGQGGAPAAGGVGLRADDTGSLRNLAGGEIRVLGPSAAGLQAHDGSVLENAAGATIVVEGADSAGMRANDNSTLRNRGSLTVTGDSATGLTARDYYYTGPLTVNAEIMNRGTLTVTGTGATGVRFGNGWWLLSNGSHRVYNAGVLTVSGDASRGVLGGDDSRFGNTGSITVTGPSSRGVEMGFDSAVLNEGVLEVSGTDAVGIAVGGNDHFGLPGDSREFLHSVSNRRPSPASPFAVIRGSADSGPLVLFTGYGIGQNRLLNGFGGRILADPTNSASPDRGIAVQGSDGVEVIENQGLIQGKLLLGAGDDVYRVGPVSTLDGSLDGGTGSDTLELLLGSAPSPFDLAGPVGFEGLTIESGGRWSLAGSGALAETVVEPFGALWLVSGQSASLAGNLQQQANSLIQAEGDPTSWSVPLQVTGTVTLEAGAFVQFLPSVPVTADARVVVLTADGGLVVADPASYLDVSTALLRATPEFGTHELALNLDVLDFVAAAATPNQREIAEQLDSIAALGADAELQLLLDELVALSPQAYAAALDQLQPEAYDAQTSTLLASAGRLTASLLERPDYCLGREGEQRRDPRTGLPCHIRGFEPWMQGFGLIQDRDGEEGHTSHESSGWGVLFGLDRRLGEELLLSAAVGGSRHIVRVENSGKARLTSSDLGLQAAFVRGPLRVQGVASYGYNWHESYRNLAFGNFARTAEADFHSQRLGTRLHAGWDFDLRGLRLAPVASLDWAGLARESFEETGAGPANLAIDDQFDSIVTARAGLELDTAWHKRGYWTDLLEVTDGIWWPRLSVGWRELLRGDERPISASLASAPAAADGFRVVGSEARRGVEIGAGLRFTPARADRLSFGVRYDAFLWDGIREHDFGADLRFSF